MMHGNMNVKCMAVLCVIVCIVVQGVQMKAEPKRMASLAALHFSYSIIRGIN